MVKALVPGSVGKSYKEEKMIERERFNTLLEYRYLLTKIKETNIICDDCKRKIDETILKIDEEINEIIERNNGVLV